MHGYQNFVLEPDGRLCSIFTIHFNYERGDDEPILSGLCSRLFIRLGHLFRLAMCVAGVFAVECLGQRVVSVFEYPLPISMSSGLSGFREDAIVSMQL
jgi:hypothetical protein